MKSENTNNKINSDNKINGDNSVNSNYPIAQPVRQPVYTTPTIIQQENNVINSNNNSNNNNDSNIEYISPLQYSVPAEFDNTIIVTENMVITYQYSSSVKVLSIFEMVLIFLYGMYNSLYMFLLFFPMYGYYGSIKFDVFMTRIYFIYQITICIIKLLDIIYNNFYSKETENNENNENILFSTIILCFNIYFAIFINTYIKSIKKLTEKEHKSLKVIRFINNSSKMFKYW